MRTRPWPLILLALFQLFTPLGTLLFNSWALGVKPAYVLGWILQKPFLKIFEILALMPIAGVALYWMKPWSYAIFLGAMFWSMGSNFSHLSFATQTYSAGMLTFVYSVQMALALYFMIPSVRKTYLDKSVRWWEAKRRYFLQIPIHLHSERGPLEGKTLNISEGGILFNTDKKLKKGDEFLIHFHILSTRYETRGRIVYSSDDSSNKYGIQFLHSPDNRKRFRHLAQALELLEIDDRDKDIRKIWYKSMKEWAATTARTGKGLVPEVKTRKT